MAFKQRFVLNDRVEAAACQAWPDVRAAIEASLSDLGEVQIDVDEAWPNWEDTA